jgi:D-3-phosphoglycerate dehydrogenase / 2-oxoglutarate reductase
MDSMSWKIVTVCDLSGAPDAVATLEKLGTLVQVGKDRARLLEELPDCDVYFGGGELEMNKEALDLAPKLKMIGSPATGKDHLDLEEIDKRGIKLVHIAEELELLQSFTATSELAFTLLLALVRRLPEALEDAKQGKWARDYYSGVQLNKKTLGILGLGRLGTISANIGQGFGMRVIANDILPKEKEGVEMVSLDRLLAESDVLSIHIHLTPENEHFVDATKLSKLKQGAILINTSRGLVIEQDALVDALSSGRLAGAGIDVIDGEWLPQSELHDNPLIAYARENNNLLISPHIGGSTTESIYGARIFMAKKIADFINSNKHTV